MRVYLCGLPAMVNAARRIAYRSGASMGGIMADAFEMTDLRKIAREETSAEELIQSQ